MSERQRLPGDGAAFLRPRQASPNGALSRRQFLRYTAVGAGALAVGGSALAQSLDPTSEKSLCSPKVFFLPRLAIVAEGGPSYFTYASPDIWVTATPDVTAPPVTSFDLAATYYPVARIHNIGTAPVFNATVVFYALAPDFVAFGSRFGALSTLGTGYVSIQPHSDRLVLCPNAFSLFIEGTVLIVECFDALTDPPVVTTGIDIPANRLVAARSL